MNNNVCHRATDYLSVLSLICGKHMAREVNKQGTSHQRRGLEIRLSIYHDP